MGNYTHHTTTDHNRNLHTRLLEKAERFTAASAPPDPPGSQITKELISPVTLQKKLFASPASPYYWHYYYEACMMHTMLNAGAPLSSLMNNPASFIAENADVLSEHPPEYHTYISNLHTCTGMAAALIMKKIKNDRRKISPADLIILSKSYAYTSVFTQPDSRKKLFNRAIKYTALAAKGEPVHGRKGEFYYYLAQFHKQTGNELMNLKFLNLAREYKFCPTKKTHIPAAFKYTFTPLAPQYKNSTPAEPDNRNNLITINFNTER